MSVLESAQSSSLQFQNVLKEEIPSYIKTLMNINPTGLKINTMTICCKSKLSDLEQLPFKMNDLRNYFMQHPFEEGIEVSNKSMGKNVIMFRWTQKYGDNNEFSKRICCKVFGNGAMHVTGVTSPVEAVLICNHFVSRFETHPFFNKNGLTESTESEGSEGSERSERSERSEGSEGSKDNTSEFTICMIQSSFDTYLRIRLDELYKQWNDPSLSLLFNNEKHHAVQVKFKETHKSLSAFIFSTGRILITGAVLPEHLNHAFTKVCSYLDQHSLELTTKRVDVVKIPQKRGRKRKADHDITYQNISL